MAGPNPAGQNGNDLADAVRQTGWLRVSEFYEVITSCICVMAVRIVQTN